ncbi:pyridoxal phosphate-dependent decarboxylase family protein [Kibdelosporangium phytohabitans]|uniref:Amino acid decarboxylase n=1 Tax=Kibdelosporangium phytohabitans TaxID=860235 RepID=A0A0N7F3P5_9PSEU|nr:pyridoxal-dependent decarboxylase [Kibdelosporangium phytohabitans]ALG09207.1 amino acid decarboxylase [Kibdelosporangium phytohabitans]MBE1469561.1 glutamate/tyrosine decarboxylase-like PLP-dependent enzyme [Kibdelosporangium phytohabitans]
MFAELAADLADLPALLDRARLAAQRVLGSLDDRPVAAAALNPAPLALPESGDGLVAALELFGARWESGLSGSAGPRYLGFVTGGATPAALAGDWLTAAADQNANTGTGSAAAGIEREAIGWLGELFGLPLAGAFVSGATMSNLVGLAIGREWLGEQAGVSVTEDGVGALGDIRVLSGSPHSSIGKSLSILGVGRRHVVTLPTLPGREAVDVSALEAALRSGPAIVVANAGTVNTVDFDDIQAVVALKQRYEFWLHVDAAFGGFAAVSPNYAHLVAGWEGADSVCVDLHKWLNVPYDSAVQFTRRPDLQAEVFHNAGSYLGLPGEHPEFMHLTPETSRRLRALPAWFTLAAYGRAGHRDIVERNVDSARALGERVDGSDRFRLLAPVRLNVVCFTTTGDERVGDVLDAVSRSGEAFLTPTVYQGVPAIRAAFSNWRTGPADVGRVCSALGM